MWSTRQLLKYTIITAGTIGSLASLKANQYDLGSIGVVRLGRAASSVLSITYLYKTKLYNQKLDVESSEYLALKSSIHRQAAEKLLALCCANKGVYIKVGQHIGALDYIVPKEYVDTMKVLHSNAPCSNLEELYQVLREDLKQDPRELFLVFDEQPLGTASLAQVHRASLHDGTTVAVKVQHPHVRANSSVDIVTMEALVKLVSWTFPEFQFQWLVDETKRNIPVELDFTQEGHNAEKIRDLFSGTPWLLVPRIYWQYSSPRVLTMQYMEGGQVNDVDYITQHKIDPVEVSSKLGQLYSDMIFIHGFVHSDPHPGNILVHKEAKGALQVILLDHGLYATLSNEIRWSYSRLWLSILNQDKAGIQEHSEAMGIQDLYSLFACMVTGRMWDSILSGVDKTRFTEGEREQFQAVLPSVLPQISEVLAKVNRQMLLIFKTNDLLRGLEHTLKTESRMSSFLVMSRACIKSVYAQRLNLCTTHLCRLHTRLARCWALFKISLYYTYLRLHSFSFS